MFCPSHTYLLSKSQFWKLFFEYLSIMYSWIHRRFSTSDFRLFTAEFLDEEEGEEGLSNPLLRSSFYFSSCVSRYDEADFWF